VSTGTDEKVEKIRLLRCDDCKTLEELPDFQGPYEHDILLETLLSRHETEGHRHRGRLIDVPKRAWDLPNMRQALMVQIMQGSPGLAAFSPGFYDVRDTFRDDALKCYHLHNRPTDGCPDYHADRKMLLPDTASERKEIGLPKPRKGTVPIHYLCDFCPLDGVIKAKQRKDL
jgi:hypothetical protein